MVAPPLLRQFLGVVNKVGGYETHTYSAPSRPSLVGSGRPLGQPAPQRSPDPPTPARLPRPARGAHAHNQPLPRMRSAFDHPHGCGKQPPCRRAAAQPPRATWRAAFGGRLQLMASVLAAQARRWRKGWLSLSPLPVVLVVDTLAAALKPGSPEGRR